MLTLPQREGAPPGRPLVIHVGSDPGRFLAAGDVLAVARDAVPTVGVDPVATTAAAVDSVPRAVSREDLVGLFYVGSNGSVSLDLSDLPEDLAATYHEHDVDGDVTEEVRVYLAESVWLSLVGGRT